MTATTPDPADALTVQNTAVLQSDYGAHVDTTDEAVDPSGRPMPEYHRVVEAFAGFGPHGLADRAAALEQRMKDDGVVFTAHVDGQLVEQAFPLDVVPRIVSEQDWRSVAAGVAQRTRALNAFLDDAYGEQAIVREGVVPDWVVAKSPGYREEARDLAPDGGVRAVLSGLDLLRDGDGHWLVLEDNLRVPSGIAYAMANRRSAAATLPELHDSAGSLASPDEAPAMLLRALRDHAPQRCEGEPQVVLLSDGPDNTAWFEHKLLGEEMGVPVVVPSDLRRSGDRIEADVDGGRVPVDVIYRRLDEDDFGALHGSDGVPLDQLMYGAVRAGTLTLLNAPGNGVADDKATYTFVPKMIEYYLGETPVLQDVSTWMLADDEQYAQVKDRLGELVVKPVDGYGGQGVTFGPELSRAELATLQEQVAATPHRFIAQEPVYFSTHPTLADGALSPRHVDLRVFAVAGAQTLTLPSPLTRVALTEGSLLVNSSQGGGSKDTWVRTS